MEGWWWVWKFFRNVGIVFRCGFGNINRFVFRFKLILNFLRGLFLKGLLNGDINFRDGDSVSFENVCNILKFIYKYIKNKFWFFW